jgi:soluble lytic murein transglycosylase-like protein
MAPVKRLSAAFTLLVMAHPAHSETVAKWRDIITEASMRFGIPEIWIERVMRAESAGQTSSAGRPIRSRAGAIGLMQLMPATWQTMRQTLDLGPNPDDPRANILAGTAYLRRLYDRFGYPGLFAAYNAGPGRYADHLSTGRPLPAETIAYLIKLRVAPSDRGVPLPIEQPRITLFAIQNDQSRQLDPAGKSASTALFWLRK